MRPSNATFGRDSLARVVVFAGYGHICEAHSKGSAVGVYGLCVQTRTGAQWATVVKE